MAGNIFVSPVILLLANRKTGREWEMSGWKIKRVNPYAPVKVDNVIPMVAVPDKARLPTSIAI